jgi:hypothetical protein
MAIWLVIAVLSVGTIAVKSAGPIALSRNRPSARLRDVMSLVAPALLAALVVDETLRAGADAPGLDARVAGVAAAALALRLRLPLGAVMATAAAIAAIVRALQ